jgi:hypothetical protein
MCNIQLFIIVNFQFIENIKKKIKIIEMKMNKWINYLAIKCWNYQGTNNIN